MTYTHLTDDELLNAIYHQDRMATSDLELELAKRFIAQSEEHALSTGMKEVLNDFDIEINHTDGIEQVRAALQFAIGNDLDTVSALMAVTTDHGIDTATELTAALERASKVEDLTNDVGEAVALLNQFFNPTPVTA